MFTQLVYQKRLCPGPARARIVYIGGARVARPRQQRWQVARGASRPLRQPISGLVSLQHLADAAAQERTGADRSLDRRSGRETARSRYASVRSGPQAAGLRHQVTKTGRTHAVVFGAVFFFLFWHHFSNSLWSVDSSRDEWSRCLLRLQRCCAPRVCLLLFLLFGEFYSNPRRVILWQPTDNNKAVTCESLIYSFM